MYLLITIIIILPFIILRIEFPKIAPKFIGIIATALGIFCLVMMYIWKLYDYDIFFSSHNNGWVELIFLISVPALYCVTFWGNNRKIWIALIPSVIYFKYYSVCSLIMFRFFFDPDYFFDRSAWAYYSELAVMSIFFGVWALLCISTSIGIYNFIKHRKNKKQRSKSNESKSL